MDVKRILAISVLLLSGCSTAPAHKAGYLVYEAAAGVNITKVMPWSANSDGGFDGPDDTIRFTVRRESNDGRTFVSYSHISHLSAGWPVNGKKEDWLDVVEFGVRFDSRSFRQ